MDFGQVGSLIASLGFPIVACGAMAFFIVKRSQANDEKLESLRREQREDFIRLQNEHRTEVEKIQNEHKEEVAKMTEALNNNTKAIDRLIDKIERGDFDGKQ